MDECKPLLHGPGPGSGVAVLFYPNGFVTPESYAVLATTLADLGRGLHSFPFQLFVSSSFHRIAQLNS